MPGFSGLLAWYDIYFSGYDIGCETYPEMTRLLCERDCYVWGTYTNNEFYTKMKKMNYLFFGGMGIMAEMIS